MSNKRPQTPDAASAKIQGIINEHLGASDASADAHLLLLSYTVTNSLDENKFAKATEIEKLEEIQRLADRIGRIWRDTDPDVRHLLAAQSSRSPVKIDGPRGRRAFSQTDEKQVLDFLTFGSTVLEKLIPGTIEAIHGGQQIGRANYPAIRLMNACADLWRRRTGETVRSTSNVRFASFVQDVFNAVGEVANVDAVSAAWRKSMQSSAET